MIDHCEKPTVVVADDEPSILAVYEQYLSGSCAVKTATDGKEALTQVDESVDVVLLDRRMAGMSGDEALHLLRDRGYDMPVGMISAVKPDHNIIGLSLDEYLTKPIDMEELQEAVELLAVRGTIDQRCREFLRLVAKKTALEDANTVDTNESEPVQQLHDRMQRLQTDLSSDIARFDVSQPITQADYKKLHRLAQETGFST